MGNFTAQMAFHLANGWSKTRPGNFFVHPFNKIVSANKRWVNGIGRILP